jgi:hypothetical protein
MKLMLDANTPASTQVRAAEIIVNHAAKAIEIENIAAQVSQLERATEASNQQPNDPSKQGDRWDCVASDINEYRSPAAGREFPERKCARECH